MSQNSLSLVTSPLHSRYGLVSLVSIAVLICMMATAATVQAQQPGGWRRTGSLNTARAGNNAMLLKNGKVLVIGWPKFSGVGTYAELYNPASETWSVAAKLDGSRDGTATLLPNGKILTLNSTTYCIGDPWSLMVIHSAPSASVRLLGVSNGASWEIVRWGTTDQEGSFRAGGKIADGTEGTHTLSVEISGVRSNALSFAVSKCKP